MENFDYLTEDADSSATTNVTLSELQSKVRKYETLKAEIERLEEVIADLKKDFNNVSQQEIPNLLLQNGIDSITVEGKKVSVTQELSATVKDMPKFVEFLESRGDASIVKTELSFGKLDPSITRLCQKVLAEKFGLYPEVKTAIHPATLKKYLKDITGLNKTECEVPLADLPNSVSVFTYYKTTVK